MPCFSYLLSLRSAENANTRKTLFLIRLLAAVAAVELQPLQLMKLAEWMIPKVMQQVVMQQVVMVGCLLDLTVGRTLAS